MKIAALLFLISAIGTGLAHQRLAGGGLPHRRRHRRRRRLGHRAGLHRRDLAAAHPRAARLAAAAGDRVRHLPVVGDRLCCWRRLAGGSREELWLGLEAWRWMFLVMAVPAIVYGVLAFTIPESPRYLVAKYRIPEARKVLSMLLGEKNLEITITRIQESLKREETAVVARSAQADRRALRHRVGRPRAVGVPAVRRHQRDLLLLQRAVGGGRIRRERVVHHHRDHVDHQHR